MARIKVSAAYRDFDKELRSLNNLDRLYQTKSNLSQSQLILLTEGLFLAAFRAYENFLEEVFLLYTLEKENISGKKPRSFLKPRNFDHSRELVRSSMPILDWSNPEIIMGRAETYLERGEPIRTVLGSAKQDLLDMKILRNHIAHNSRESILQYQKMLRRLYGTSPLKAVTPGKHLLTQVRGTQISEYYLIYYLNKLSVVGKALAN